MPSRKAVTIFKKETASELLGKLGKAGRTSLRDGLSIGTKGINSLPFNTQTAVIGIVEEHAEKGGYYKIQFVARDDVDFDYTEHTWYKTQETDDLLGYELNGTEGLEEDDKQAFIATPIITSQGSVVWVFSLGGGEAKRHYAVINEDEITAKIYENYAAFQKNDTPIDQSGQILIPNAVTSAVKEGDQAFVEEVIADGEQKTYILSAYILI